MARHTRASEGFKPFHLRRRLRMTAARLCYGLEVAFDRLLPTGEGLPWPGEHSMLMISHVLAAPATGQHDRPVTANAPCHCGPLCPT
jgi:hypothetical protein